MANRDHEEEMLMRSMSLRHGAPPGALLMPRRRGEQGLLESQQARRDAEERLRHVLDTISDGYVELDRDWGIRRINLRAEELLRPPGAGRRPLPGKNLWQEFPELLDDTLSIALLQAMERRESRDVECHLAPLQRWLEVRTRASADGLTLYLRDITQNKAGTAGAIEREAQLHDAVTRLREAALRAAEERQALLDSERSARAEAERNSQVKDEFLATLSHELRTPLSAILGWAQVLRRGTRDEADLHRGLQTIERNARAQAQLIEDLLDMGRITSGQVQLHMQTLTPAGIVEAAIEAARPGAAAKNIRIDTVIEPGAGLVSGDPNRLQQVFFNLLSNALKFTPRDGAVTVTVRQPAGLALAEITVSDTGIGIRPEFLAHVFERFRQADASTTRRHGGLGLGLSIVKHLVEQHGGAVHARSGGEDQGAAFCVQLPLIPPAQQVQQVRQPGHAALTEQQQQTADSAAERRAQAAAAQSVPAAAAVHDLSGVKVLLVDDQADARDLAKRILQDCHAEVLTAGSAAEALRLLPGAHADLLIS